MRALLCLAGVGLWGGAVYALYVPPPVPFITDPNEQTVVLDIRSGTIASVQSVATGRSREAWNRNALFWKKR